MFILWVTTDGRTAIALWKSTKTMLTPTTNGRQTVTQPKVRTWAGFRAAVRYGVLVVPSGRDESVRQLICRSVYRVRSCHVMSSALLTE